MSDPAFNPSINNTPNSTSPAPESPSINPPVTDTAPNNQPNLASLSAQADQPLPSDNPPPPGSFPASSDDLGTNQYQPAPAPNFPQSPLVSDNPGPSVPFESLSDSVIPDSHTDSPQSSDLSNLPQSSPFTPSPLPTPFDDFQTAPNPSAAPDSFSGSVVTPPNSESPTPTDPSQSSGLSQLSNSPSTPDNHSTIQPSNHSPSPDSFSSPRLSELAKQYTINIQKPHFPVNTLRLYYLLLVDSLTQGHKVALDKANQIIPKISTLLNTREQYAGRSTPNPVEELKTCKPQIEAIKTIIDTPIVDSIISHLFTYIYPLQDQLLISLDHNLKQPQLTPADLLTTIKIRAMDSIAYSSLLGEIIHSYKKQDTSNKSESSSDHISQLDARRYDLDAIHWQINLTSQINDLIDAVVYAQQDLEAGTATLIDIIRKINPEPNAAEQLLTETFNTLLQKSTSFPLPEATQTVINDFNHNLIAVLRQGQPPASEAATSQPNPSEPPPATSSPASPLPPPPAI